MIHIQVRLFGPAADAVGDDTLEYGLMPPASLGALVDLLYARHPKLAACRASLRFAVNEAYTDLDAVLQDKDVVAVIPPVAGGDHDWVELTDRPLDVAAIRSRVQDPACGAVLVFEGTVRADGPVDDPLTALEYSAYESMAIRQLTEIRQSALSRYAIRQVAIVHRLGRLNVSETSLVVAIAAAHRTDALRACEWIIEALKRDVAIWKKEIWNKANATWVCPPDGGPH